MVENIFLLEIKINLFVETDYKIYILKIYKDPFMKNFSHRDEKDLKYNYLNPLTKIRLLKIAEKLHP